MLELFLLVFLVLADWGIGCDRSECALTSGNRKLLPSKELNIYCVVANYSGSQKSEVCPMPYALYPIPYALCP